MSQQLAVIGGSGGGGGGGGSARPPVTAPDSLRSVAIVEFLDAWGEGEIEGFATADPLESCFLEDTPIKTNGTLNFQGVSLDYRLGTQDQTYIAGQEMSADEDASAAIEFNVGTNITLAAPVTRTISSPLANAIRVTVNVAALWKRNTSTGDVNGHSVSLMIQVKGNGGSFVTVNLAGRGTIRGKASSPYERSFHIELSQFGVAPYDIKVSRTSSEITDGTVADALAWTSYTELVYAKLRYPNTALARLSFDARHFQQVPRRGYLLKGIKVRVPGPAFYDPVLRTYTGLDWDGTFVTAWTRCPVWSFYDIITDPRYGLGKEVPKAYLDKWNLFTIAKRCDEIIPDGFGGTEPRYSLDLYLQQAGSAKKVIQDIVSSFDGMAFWHGGGVFVSQDAPKAVSSLYTPANVVGGRFNYASSGRQVRYTVALVQWNDPDDFYKIATEYVEDTDGIARYGYREKTIVAMGCISRGQAHRAGKRILLTSRLETDTPAFAVGLSGLVNKPGDITRIADPLKNNNLKFGGRVSQGATTTTIPLDRSVTLTSGDNYTLCMIMPDGEVTTTPVVNAAGETQVIETFPALPVPPDHEANWSLYSGQVPSREYRILWITENSGEEDDGFYAISAVNYDPAKYAEIDNIGQLEPIYQKPYANTNQVTPPTGIVTSDGVYLGLEGMVRYVDISWTASADVLLAGHIIKWSLDNGEETEQAITGNSYRIENAKQGTYKIEVHAVNIAGHVSSSVTVDHILGFYYQITSVSVTNLFVLGAGGNTFNGRNAEFTWDTDADTVINASNNYGVGNGGQTPWFRDYRVRVYQAGNLLRTEYVTEAFYSYSYEMNVQDGGPFRAISIDVAARDFYGNFSNQAALAVSNPPPTTFSNIALTAGSGQIFVEYYPPSDPDYIYTRVFASQTAGFVPDATSGTGNMVTEGSDRVMSFPVGTGTWYIRLQGVDEFGVSGAVYSSQLSLVVSSSDVTAEVDAILADPGRSGDVVVEADRFIIVQPSTYATPTAVFAVGLVDGVSKVAIKGDLLLDGTLFGRSLVAGAVTADKMTVTQLSAVSADMGTLTAGTIKTSSGTASYRVEISDTGGYPLWYGTGDKNAANALFYVDDAGSALFGGAIDVNNGTFTVSQSGNVAIKAGTIDINAGNFSIDSLGNAEMRSIVIKNDSGQVLLSSGTGTEWQFLANRPDNTQLLNSNTTPSDIGYTGDLNATVGATWGLDLANEPQSLNDISTDEFDVIASQNSDSFIAGNIIPNGNMTLVGVDGRPVGAKAVYGGPTTTNVSYLDTNKTILKLQHPVDTNIGVGFPAFRVNTGTTYKVIIRVKSNVASASGLYFRIQELDTDLDVGMTHVSASADNSESGVQNATGQIKVLLENRSIGLAWETHEFIYTPTVTTKWASPILLNWVGMGNSELHLDRIVIYSQSTVGATWGTNIADPSSTMPANNADVTGDNVAHSVLNQTGFATLSQITPANISTYIANLAVKNAQIADLAVTNAKIDALAVTTLKIDDNAVTIPVAVIGASVSLPTSGAWKNVVSSSITLPNIPGSSTILVSMSAQINGTTYWGSYTLKWSNLMHFRLLRDGVVVRTLSTRAHTDVHLPFKDYVANNTTYVYTVQGRVEYYNPQTAHTVFSPFMSLSGVLK